MIFKFHIRQYALRTPEGKLVRKANAETLTEFNEDALKRSIDKGDGYEVVELDGIRGTIEIDNQEMRRLLNG